NTHFGFDGTRKQLGLSTAASVLTSNFWIAGLTLEVKPANSFTTRETSDGARFQLSDELRADFDIESDGRRRPSSGFGAEQVISPGTELRMRNAYAFSTLRPTPLV